MTTRASLIAALHNYKTIYDEEREFIPRFIELLKHENAYQRTHLPGHITGSAWIVSHDGTKVLLVEHAKLRKWLQPGGHADGDENILRVALREAHEETGLMNLVHARPGILDIDIHTIPERKDLPFPQHYHFDVRFLFQALPTGGLADETEELKISDESTDLKWIELTDLEKYNSERSILRLRDKLV